MTAEPTRIERPPTPGLLGYTVAFARYRTAEWLLAGSRRMALYGRIRPSLRDHLVCRDTRLVIEGYPRSANSYAFSAFRRANGLDFPLARHVHSATNVHLGVRRNLPVVVLVREPLDAVASLVLRVPSMPVRIALGRYVRFHEGVLPVADHVVVVPYQLAISDFAAVVEETNRRYGTSFRPYERSTANEAAVRAEVEEMQLMAVDRDPGRAEMAVARPSEARAALKPLVVERIRHDGRMLAAAEAAYCAMAPYMRWAESLSESAREPA